MPSNLSLIPAGTSLDSIQTLLDSVVAAGTPGGIILAGEYTWAGSLTLNNAANISILGVNCWITQSNAVDSIVITDSTDVLVSDLNFIGGVDGVSSSGGSGRCRNITLSGGSGQPTDLDSYWGVDEIILHPTGVAATDTANINQALQQGGRVILRGTFTVNAQIVIPVDASLCGSAGKACLVRSGSGTSGYMVKVEGGASRRGYALENIWIYDNQLARGVLFDKCWYAPLYHNLYVRGGRQVGVDFVDCWGSWGVGLYVYTCKGIGARWWRCNGATFISTSINSCTDSDWPDAADETVADYASDYVQTPEALRAAAVITAVNTEGASEKKQDASLYDSMSFENNVLTSKPLIASSIGSSTLRNLRFESNNSTGAVMLLHGNPAYNVRWGNTVVIDGVMYMSNTNAETFLELSGGCRNVIVRNLQSSDIDDSVIRCADEAVTHYNIQADNCYVPAVSGDSWVDAGASATITNDIPLSVPSLADSAAPNNSFYYSTTQSALAYKDGSGAVNIFGESPPP